MLSNIHILLVDVSVLCTDKLMMYRQLTEWGPCVKEGIMEEGLLGNGVNNATLWTPVLDSIQNTLKRWDQGHPTIQGKRLIVQMVAGGKSQYLTRVQGMPANVTKRLTKIIKEFMKTLTPIVLETLYQPAEKGGIGLSDVESRNAAIKAVWMQDFLKFGEDRPAWAYLYNKELERADSNPKDLYPKTNMFLQSWRPVTQGARANLIPTPLRQMIKAAQNMEVNLEAIKIGSDIQHMMPAWSHPAVPKRTYHSGRDECLVTTHKVRTVWDLTLLARRTGTSAGRQGEHQTNARCTCRDCAEDRGKGCENPHKCSTTANKILDKIYPKMNPSLRLPNNDLSLTPERIEKNRQTLVDMEGLITFDPSVTIKNSLDKCFRIFARKDKTDKEPATRMSRITRGMSVQHKRAVVTVESSCHSEGQPDAECVGGLWCKEDSAMTAHIKANNQKSTRMSAELTILIQTLRTADPSRPLTIRSSL
jgi:hypothetical protein